MTDNSPVTAAVSKVVWNQIGMDPGEGVRTPDLLEDTRVLLQKRDGGGRRGRGRRKGERKGEGGRKRERERSMNGKGKERWLRKRVEASLPGLFFFILDITTDI